MRCLMLVVCLAIPVALSAQQNVGSGGGELSARTYYIVFFRRSPDGAAVTDLVILLRGAPGWMRGAGGEGRSTGRSSMGPPGSGRPVTMGLNLGKVRFECSYLPNGRILRLGGTDYPLGGDNIIVIDRIDEEGGAATILRPNRVELPAYTRTFAEQLRRLPELRQYIH